MIVTARILEGDQTGTLVRGIAHYARWIDPKGRAWLPFSLPWAKEWFLVPIDQLSEFAPTHEYVAYLCERLTALSEFARDVTAEVLEAAKPVLIVEPWTDEEIAALRENRPGGIIDFDAEIDRELFDAAVEEDERVGMELADALTDGAAS